MERRTSLAVSSMIREDSGFDGLLIKSREGSRQSSAREKCQERHKSRTNVGSRRVGSC